MMGHRPSHLPTISMGCFVVDPPPNKVRNRPSRMRPSNKTRRTPGSARTRPMNAQQLLQEISDYCRQTGLAESTSGRRAVNDGKLASRLRNGGRITTDTLDRIRSFMVENRADMVGRPALIPRAQ